MKKIITVPKFLTDDNDMKIIFTNIVNYYNRLSQLPDDEKRANILSNYEYEIIRLVRKLDDSKVSLLETLNNVLKFNVYINSLATLPLYKIYKDIVEKYKEFKDVNDEDIKQYVNDYTRIYSLDTATLIDECKEYTELIDINNELVLFTIDDYIIKGMTGLGQKEINTFNNKLNTILLGKIKTHVQFTKQDEQLIYLLTRIQ